MACTVVAGFTITAGQADAARTRVAGHAGLEDLRVDASRLAAEAAQYESEAEAITRRLDTANRLIERADWSELLLFIARGVGGETRVERLAVAAQPGSTAGQSGALSIQISGNAKDRAALRDLIAFLEGEPLAAEVELGRVNITGEGRASFQIEAGLSLGIAQEGASP